MTSTLGNLVIEDNLVINVLRIVASLGSVFVLALLVSTFRRRPSYMLAGAIVFAWLAAVGEAQQVGEPFIVYQLPVRLAIVFLFWRAYRRGEHRTVVASE